MIERIQVPLWRGDGALPIERILDEQTTIYVLDLRTRFGDPGAALDPAERVRLAGYRNQGAALRFAGGRAVLKSVMAAHHGVAAPVVEVGAGKPRVPGGPEVSLAHGGDLVVVAAAADPIGIDVEPLRTPGADLTRGALHPDERATGAGAFTRLWTAKEAYLKQIGAGLAVDPRLLLVEAEAARVLDTRTGARTAVRWLERDGHILCWTR